jgi:hypothetical protein
MTGDPIDADGPIAAARAWHRALVARDVDAAWKLTDEPLRRDLVECWLQHVGADPRDAEPLVRHMLSPTPDADVWDVFLSALLDTFDSFRTVQGADRRRWGWATDPRPVALDYELALMVDLDGAAVHAHVFLCRHDAAAGWLVNEAPHTLPGVTLPSRIPATPATI